MRLLLKFLGNFTVEQEVSKRLYLQYSEDIMKEAKGVLEEVPREFFRCDPRKHEEGETYVQLTELLQVRRKQYMILHENFARKLR